MMKDSPLAPEKWSEHPYLYNDSRRVPLQRPAMVLDLLDATKSATLEQATAIALSPQVWHAELWQERIRKAAPENAFGKMLTEWDRRSDADSRGALGFYLFKTALGADGRAMDPPDSLSDEAVREALAKTEQRLKTDFPPDAVFGTLFTPLGLKPTVLFPGTNGGANWGGASFDPETQTLFVNSMDVGMLFRMVKAPDDFEHTNPHMIHGTFHGGDRGLAQSGGLRPVPGWGQYRMPIPGLYQTGGTTHPGGSITGAPGRNAAMVVLQDLGTSLDEVVKAPAAGVR